jgi:hypothetical protein
VKKQPQEFSGSPQKEVLRGLFFREISNWIEVRLPVLTYGRVNDKTEITELANLIISTRL